MFAPKCFTPQRITAWTASVAYPFSMFRGGKHPAQLRSIFQRRFHFSFVVGKTGLTNKISAFSFFHNPVSKTKKRPMTEIAEKARPALLRGERLASNVLRDRGVSPKRRTVRKVIHAMAAEPQALSLDNGNI